MSPADRLILLTLARALRRGTARAADTYTPKALADAFLRARGWSAL